MNNKGLTTRIILDGATCKVDKDAMIGTTKAAVLNAGEHCQNLSSFSL